MVFPIANEVIRTCNLHRRFDMGEATIHALDSVDISIARGEYCAIMGPSGSGKSTLMNVIGCLDVADEGQYWLDGQLVSDMSDRKLAQVRNRFVGFVFQTFNLLPNATALQNVEVPLIYAGIRRKQRIQQAASALGRVGLANRLQHKPGQLSGGQRQRLAIARAIVTQPSILLADEPTGNLDTATAAEIMSLFRTLHDAGNTIVLVTHDSGVAKHAQRIIGMRDGRIVSNSVKDHDE